MQDILGESLNLMKKLRVRKVRLVSVLLLLSLLVSLDVFWVMRQPGLTLAGDADCGITEHTHDDTCKVKECICTVEAEPHVHNDSCYETRFVEAVENHILTCQIEEVPHEHTDSCYDTTITIGNEDHLVCEILYQPHQHKDSCFETEITEAYEETVLICTLPEQVHIHDDSCYQWKTVCELPEHVHTLDCYSDDTADVETLLDWQEMFKEYPFTGNIREDLVGIAKTQVGYSESTLNFIFGTDGIKRGYTRYGAWYGSPYNDWSAMFVSFCLSYAGADLDQMPINIGASAMMQQWKTVGRYASASDYAPSSGDLVFFNDTVGIVTEVQNSSVYVICGDVENTVTTSLLLITDKSIQGWGITEETLPDQEEEQQPEAEEPKDEGSGIADSPLLDISDGPAVFIFEGGRSLFRLRRSKAAPIADTTDLITYLKANGGDYFFTLLDMNNQELPKDDAGNYIVQANTKYKVTISITSPEGFHPGTYVYDISNGAIIDGGEGTFILTDGTNVGDWTVTDDGLITLNFNDHMNSRTDITISATLGMHFPASEDPIDFDGKISVTVQKPQEEIKPTAVTKWGMQGDEVTSGKTDTTKIYWNVNIVGNADSNIVGNTITDEVLTGEWMGTHKYTQSDMESGLKFGVSDPDWGWHAWTVYPGDPNLTWTEDGWTYTMPETITCWCGEVALGNEGWVYYIDYSSTPDKSLSPGTLYYMNRLTVDNQTAEGGVNFTQGEILGEVMKTGSFVSDANGGAFLWEFQVLIPGRHEGQKAEYSWFIMDYMYLINNEGYRESPVKNDANLVMVTATYNGQTVQVPRIQDATDDDLIAWDNAWTAVNNGIEYGQQLSFLCRCNCNEETCQFSHCDEYWFQRDDGTWATAGFCQCWTVTDNILFTFVYRTEDISVVESYGGIGYQLQNIAELYYIPNGGPEGALVSISQANVPIPGIFQKTLSHDFDGYTANYKVTINESKLNLTNGTPLTIHDMMTQTLTYVNGSMVITAEDANGIVTTLKYGVDYTVTYDGTGNQTDQYGNPVHMLDIVILHPQPVMYTLDYDTTLIIPPGTTQAIKYSNSATITLWGKDITNNTVEKLYADINISAKSYKVEMYKTCATTGEPLGGATFGLYNEKGGLIDTAVSDKNGQLNFKTNIIEGVILREHILYYLQELKPPPGYMLDDTKFWFCFCDSSDDYCETCEQVMAGADALRIPFEKLAKVNVSNQLIDYDLPSTGGIGTYPLILVGITLIVIPLVYTFILRRKRERRGDG